MPRPAPRQPRQGREPRLALVVFLLTPLLLALGVQRLAATGTSAAAPSDATADAR